MVYMAIRTVIYVTHDCIVSNILTMVGYFGNQNIQPKFGWIFLLRTGTYFFHISTPSVSGEGIF